MKAQIKKTDLTIDSYGADLQNRLNLMLQDPTHDKLVVAKT